MSDMLLLRPCPDRREELLRAIRHEYLHLPDLALTTDDACRLFDLEPGTCRALLGCLVDDGVLVQAPGGTFVAQASRRRGGKMH